MASANTTEAAQLIERVRQDEQDRTDFLDRLESIRTERFRQSGTHASYPYPGAPDIVEPIIDDALSDARNKMLSLIWRSQNRVLMLGTTAQALQAQAQAASLYNYLIDLPRMRFRSRTSRLIDLFMQDGVAFAKVIDVDVTDWFPGASGTVAAFDPVDVRDLICPTSTTDIEQAERVCHQLWYTEREFTEMAQEYGWRNWRNVLSKLRKNKAELEIQAQQTGELAQELGSPVAEVQGAEQESALDLICVWEVYHWKKAKTGGNRAWRRTRTIICPDVTEYVLQQIPWSERWPFYTFRYEERGKTIWDTRGVGELVFGNQQLASTFKSVKGIQMDYWGNPLFTTDRPLQNALKPRIKPGAVLTEGLKPAPMQPIDGVWDQSADIERAIAQRRTGSTQGAFSSTTNKRETKTAKEVGWALQEALETASVAVMGFSEPFGAVLQAMWDRICTHRPMLAMPNAATNDVAMVNDALWDMTYIVRSALSSSDANPYYKLQVLQTIWPLLAQTPAGQFIHWREATNKLLELVDPVWAQIMLADPQQGTDVPIEQAVQRLSEMVMGNQQQGTAGLAQLVNQNREMLAGMAQAEVQEEQTRARDELAEKAVRAAQSRVGRPEQGSGSAARS